MLGALDYRVIRKVQHIIWNPRNQPYQTLKKALIKLYKISDDNRFDRLLHQTDLGDRKPSELLSELRTLLGESCSDNADLNKLLHKFFLDKLPPQVRLVLAGSPQPTLELTAQRADDIMATMSSAPSLNSNAAQLLHNQMFERHLDQLTDALEASLIFAKTMIMALLIATTNFPVLRNFANQSAVSARFLTFTLAEKCRRIPRRIVVFPLDPQLELIRRTFASFVPALAIKL